MRFISGLIAVSAVCCLLTCCRWARAEMIYTGLNADVEISEPVMVGDGTENLLLVNLSIVGKNGALLSGFDGTISGPLHQQSAAETPTPSLDEPRADTIFLTNIDTHFNVHNDDVIVLFPMSETLGSVASSGEATDATGTDAAIALTSLGSSLSGTFVRMMGESTASWNLAQIVVPRGSTVSLEFEIGIRQGTQNSLEIVTTSFDVGSRPGVIGDLTGDRFVDFEDLTLLLANWDEMVAAGQGNLVDPGTTVVNFQDLT
ncbi:MAG: hypothetical protein IIA67_11735, partial [Planctomycetes bacterium]|nr:hypothetical protein [Planctomycetota bacterium]